MNSNQHTGRTQADIVHDYLTAAPNSTRGSIAHSLDLTPRQVGSALTNLINRGRATTNSASNVARYTAAVPLPRVHAPIGAIKSNGAIVMDLIGKTPGLNQSEIIAGTGLTPVAINGAINQLKLAERLTYQAIGNKHYYYPVARVRAPKLIGTPATGENAVLITPAPYLTKDERQDIAVAKLRAARKIPSIFFIS
jgi:hypothetical protein